MNTTTGDSAYTLKPPTTTTPLSKSRPLPHELPDEPLATIQHGKSGVFDLGELWAHRELLYFLTWRDLKVRYKQTLFGVAWVVMQPLLMTLIFTVFLGILARVPTGGLPYPLMVFAGLVPWTFFSTAVTGCCYSLTGNANLITKVYFPRVLVPAANIAARLVDFGISFAILIALMIFYRFVLHYRVPMTWNLAALPFMIVLVTLFAFALGTLASCLNVKYRDVSVALPVVIQLWMFVSPVIYPTNPVVPEKWRSLYFLNPLAGIIEGFRSALLGGNLNMFALGVATIATIILLICAALIFRQTEKGFADVI
jgi:lipopolysaccharide transport system permease protein